MSTAAVDDLPCREVVELVTDYLEGALEPATRIRFERHLAQCPFCVEFVNQVRRTIELTGSVGSGDVELASRERLLEAFRGWRGPQAG